MLVRVGVENNNEGYRTIAWAEEVPKEPLARLEKVHARMLAVLPGLEGKHQVVGVDGEFWSPRKLLCRALWHERDHFQHIQKLL